MRTIMLALMGLLSAGCAGGAASLVLKSPVEDKCKELKLKSCDHLSEGVVLYIDGNKAKGYQELRAGIASNADEPIKLKALAQGLKLLQKAPGVGPYVAMMRPVIELMDDAANEALLKRKDEREEEDRETEEKPRVAKRPATPGPSGPAESPTPASAGALPARGVSLGKIRTGTVIWGQGRGERCSLLSGAPEVLASGAAVCVLVLDGPLSVSDLHTSGACPVDLFVFSGDPEKPRWLVHAPAGKVLDLHGASLAVTPGAPLQVAALSSTGQSPPALGCALTWSAQRT
jgi:hypothetical protein